MQPTDPLKAKLAIECRKIRLWIASHPGCSRNDLRRQSFGQLDMALGKMNSMGIIRCEQTYNKGARTVKWFVVPQ